MKKLLSKILIVSLMMLIVLPSFTGCAPREEVLKILNWGEYIDKTTLKNDFKEYYSKATGGKKITVKYSTIADNEKMYNRYNVKTKPDYDLICPSEYMIQRMLTEGMLDTLTRDENTGDYTYVTNFNNINSTLRGLTYTASVNGTDVTYNIDDYAVPYMWGTAGILYNVDYVTQAEVETWSNLLNPQGKFVKKVSMKDSMRDAFLVAGVYNNRETLLPLYGTPEHKARLQEFVDDYSTTAIAGAKTVLSNLKPSLYSYESDEGKGQMVTGKFYMGLMWSGDAVWGFDEDMGVKKNSKLNLAYYVPHEGSNIWTDSFVIPKYAANKTAAEIFLNYICEIDIAKRNMIASGYTSAVEDACTEYRAELEEDEMWDSAKVNARGAEWAAWYKQMYLDTLFPPQDVIDRCAVMKDFASANSAITTMWKSVR